MNGLKTGSKVCGYGLINAILNFVRGAEESHLP